MTPKKTPFIMAVVIAIFGLVWAQIAAPTGLKPLTSHLLSYPGTLPAIKYRRGIFEAIISGSRQSADPLSLAARQEFVARLPTIPTIAMVKEDDGGGRSTKQTKEDKRQNREEKRNKDEDEDVGPTTTQIIDQTRQDIYTQQYGTETARYNYNYDTGKAATTAQWSDPKAEIAGTYVAPNGKRYNIGGAGGADTAKAAGDLADAVATKLTTLSDQQVLDLAKTVNPTVKDCSPTDPACQQALIKKTITTVAEQSLAVGTIDTKGLAAIADAQQQNVAAQAEYQAKIQAFLSPTADLKALAGCDPKHPGECRDLTAESYLRGLGADSTAVHELLTLRDTNIANYKKDLELVKAYSDPTKNKLDLVKEVCGANNPSCVQNLNLTNREDFLQDLHNQELADIAKSQLAANQIAAKAIATIAKYENSQLTPNTYQVEYDKALAKCQQEIAPGSDPFGISCKVTAETTAEKLSPKELSAPIYTRSNEAVALKASCTALGGTNCTDSITSLDSLAALTGNTELTATLIQTQKLTIQEQSAAHDSVASTLQSLDPANYDRLVADPSTDWVAQEAALNGLRQDGLTNVVIGWNNFTAGRFKRGNELLMAGEQQNNLGMILKGAIIQGGDAAMVITAAAAIPLAAVPLSTIGVAGATSAVGVSGFLGTGISVATTTQMISNATDACTFGTEESCHTGIAIATISGAGMGLGLLGQSAKLVTEGAAIGNLTKSVGTLVNTSKVVQTSMSIANVGVEGLGAYTFTDMAIQTYNDPNASVLDKASTIMMAAASGGKLLSTTGSWLIQAANAGKTLETVTKTGSELLQATHTGSSYLFFASACSKMFEGPANADTTAMCAMGISGVAQPAIANFETTPTKTAAIKPSEVTTKIESGEKIASTKQLESITALEKATAAFEHAKSLGGDIPIEITNNLELAREAVNLANAPVAPVVALPAFKPNIPVETTKSKGIVATVLESIGIGNKKIEGTGKLGIEPTKPMEAAKVATEKLNDAAKATEFETRNELLVQERTFLKQAQKANDAIGIKNTQERIDYLESLTQPETYQEVVASRQNIRAELPPTLTSEQRVIELEKLVASREKVANSTRTGDGLIDGLFGDRAKQRTNYLQEQNNLLKVQKQLSQEVVLSKLSAELVAASGDPQKVSAIQSNIDRISTISEVKIDTGDIIVDTLFENIVRNHEVAMQKTAGTGVVFSVDAAQTRAFLEIMSTGEIVKEFALAGGKTSVIGPLVMKAGERLYGRTGQFIAAEGQAAAAYADMVRAITNEKGVSVDRISDVVLFNDSKQVLAMKDRILNAKHVVTDVQSIEFLETMVLSGQAPTTELNAAREVLAKLRSNTQVFADEAHLNFDPSKHFVTGGAEKTPVETWVKIASENVKNALLDLGILSPGKDAYLNSDLVKTETLAGKKNTQFTEAGLTEIAKKIAAKLGMNEEVVIEIVRSPNLAAEGKLSAVEGVSPTQVNEVLNHVEVIIEYGKKIAMDRGSDFGPRADTEGGTKTSAILAKDGVAQPDQQISNQVQAVVFETVASISLGREANVGAIEISSKSARATFANHIEAIRADAASALSAGTGTIGRNAGTLTTAYRLAVTTTNEILEKFIGTRGDQGAVRQENIKGIGIKDGTPEGKQRIIELSVEESVNIKNRTSGNQNTAEVVLGGKDIAVDVWIDSASKNERYTRGETHEFIVKEFGKETWQKITTRDGKIIETKIIEYAEAKAALDNPATKNTTVVIGEGGSTGTDIQALDSVAGIDIISTETGRDQLDQSAARIARKRGSGQDTNLMIIGEEAGRVVPKAELRTMANEVQARQNQQNTYEAISAAVDKASTDVLVKIIMEGTEGSASVIEARKLLIEIQNPEQTRNLSYEVGSSDPLVVLEGKIKAINEIYSEVRPGGKYESFWEAVKDNAKVVADVEANKSGTGLEFARPGEVVVTRGNEGVFGARNMTELNTRFKESVTPDLLPDRVASSGLAEQIIVESTREAEKVASGNSFAEAISGGNESIAALLTIPAQVANSFQAFGRVLTNTANTLTQIPLGWIRNLNTNSPTTTIPELNYTINNQSVLDTIDRPDFESIAFLTNTDQAIAIARETDGNLYVTIDDQPPVQILNSFEALSYIPNPDDVINANYNEQDATYTTPELSPDQIETPVAPVRYPTDLRNVGLIEASQNIVQNILGQLSGAQTSTAIPSSATTPPTISESIRQNIATLIKPVATKPIDTTPKIEWKETQLKKYDTSYVTQNAFVDKYDETQPALYLSYNGTENTPFTLALTTSITSQTIIEINGIPRNFGNEFQIYLNYGDVITFGNTSVKIVSDSTDATNIQWTTTADSSQDLPSKLASVTKLKKGASKTQALAEVKENLQTKYTQIIRLRDLLTQAIADKPDISHKDMLDLTLSEGQKSKLSTIEINNLLFAVSSYMTKHAKVEELREAYPDPKKLWEKAFGFAPEDDVEIQYGNKTISFITKNKRDFAYAYKFSPNIQISTKTLTDKEIDEINLTYGFMLPDTTKIPNTENIFTISNGNYLPQEVTDTIAHEIEHALHSTNTLAFQNSQNTSINDQIINKALGQIIENTKNANYRLQVANPDIINLTDDEKSQIADATEKNIPIYIKKPFYTVLFNGSKENPIYYAMSGNLGELTGLMEQIAFSSRVQAENKVADELLAWITGAHASGKIISNEKENIIEALQGKSYTFIKDSMTVPELKILNNIRENQVDTTNTVFRSSRYIKPFFAKYYTTEAQDALVKQGFDAYQTLRLKGYTHEAASILLQSTRLAYWRSLSRRMPDINPENITSTTGGVGGSIFNILNKFFSSFLTLSSSTQSTNQIEVTPIESTNQFTPAQEPTQQETAAVDASTILSSQPINIEPPQVILSDYLIDPKSVSLSSNLSASMFDWMKRAAEALNIPIPNHPLPAITNNQSPIQVTSTLLLPGDLSSTVQTVEEIAQAAEEDRVAKELARQEVIKTNLAASTRLSITRVVESLTNPLENIDLIKGNKEAKTAVVEAMAKLSEIGLAIRTTRGGTPSTPSTFVEALTSEQTQTSLSLIVDPTELEDIANILTDLQHVLRAYSLSAREAIITKQVADLLINKNLLLPAPLEDVLTADEINAAQQTQAEEYNRAIRASQIKLAEDELISQQARDLQLSTYTQIRSFLTGARDNLGLARIIYTTLGTANISLWNDAYFWLSRLESRTAFSGVDWNTTDLQTTFTKYFSASIEDRIPALTTVQNTQFASYLWEKLKPRAIEMQKEIKIAQAPALTAEQFAQTRLIGDYKTFFKSEMPSIPQFNPQTNQPYSLQEQLDMSIEFARSKAINTIMTKNEIYFSLNILNIIKTIIADLDQHIIQPNKTDQQVRDEAFAKSIFTTSTWPASTSKLLNDYSFDPIGKSKLAGLLKKQFDRELRIALDARERSLYAAAQDKRRLEKQAAEEKRILAAGNLKEDEDGDYKLSAVEFIAKQILNVGIYPSQEEIKTAYRNTSLVMAPDVNKSPNAEIIFKAINDAYKILRTDKISYSTRSDWDGNKTIKSTEVSAMRELFDDAYKPDSKKTSEQAPKKPHNKITWPAEVTFGREGGLSEVSIDYASRKMSRLHFSIGRDFHGYYIVDLDSGNGTTVGKYTINSGEKFYLEDGDVIDTGEFFTVTFTDDGMELRHRRTDQIIHLNGVTGRVTYPRKSSRADSDCSFCPVEIRNPVIAALSTTDITKINSIILTEHNDHTFKRADLQNIVSAALFTRKANLTNNKRYYLRALSYLALARTQLETVRSEITPGSDTLGFTETELQAFDKTIQQLLLQIPVSDTVGANDIDDYLRLMEDAKTHLESMRDGANNTLPNLRDVSTAEPILVVNKVIGDILDREEQNYETVQVDQPTLDKELIEFLVTNSNNIDDTKTTELIKLFETIRSKKEEQIKNLRSYFVEFDYVTPGIGSGSVRIRLIPQIILHQDGTTEAIIVITTGSPITIEAQGKMIEELATIITQKLEIPVRVSSKEEFKQNAPALPPIILPAESVIVQPERTTIDYSFVLDAYQQAYAGHQVTLPPITNPDVQYDFENAIQPMLDSIAKTANSPDYHDLKTKIEHQLSQTRGKTFIFSLEDIILLNDPNNPDINNYLVNMELFATIEELAKNNHVIFWSDADKSTIDTKSVKALPPSLQNIPIFDSASNNEILQMFKENKSDEEILSKLQSFDSTLTLDNVKAGRGLYQYHTKAPTLLGHGETIYVDSISNKNSDRLFKQGISVMYLDPINKPSPKFLELLTIITNSKNSLIPSTDCSFCSVRIDETLKRAAGNTTQAIRVALTYHNDHTFAHRGRFIQSTLNAALYERLGDLTNNRTYYDQALSYLNRAQSELNNVKSELVVGPEVIEPNVTQFDPPIQDLLLSIPISGTPKAKDLATFRSALTSAKAYLESQRDSAKPSLLTRLTSQPLFTLYLSLNRTYGNLIGRGEEDTNLSTATDLPITKTILNNILLAQVRFKLAIQNKIDNRSPLQQFFDWIIGKDSIGIVLNPQGIAFGEKIAQSVINTFTPPIMTPSSSLTDFLNVSINNNQENIIFNDNQDLTKQIKIPPVSSDIARKLFFYKEIVGLFKLYPSIDRISFIAPKGVNRSELDLLETEIDNLQNQFYELVQNNDPSLTRSNTSDSEILQDRFIFSQSDQLLYGQGGMGSVRLGWDNALKKSVIIKQTISSNDNAELRRMLVAEAKVLANLNQPNIPISYDIFSENNQLYFVMDYVSGPDIKEYLSQAKSLGQELDTQDLFKIFTQLATNLDYIHSQKFDTSAPTYNEDRKISITPDTKNGKSLVHGDIKEVNVVINPELGVMLIDFGISNIGLIQSKNDYLETVIGSPNYFSPSQLSSSDFLQEPRHDNRSLIVMMHHLFTGKYPFLGDNTFDIMSNIRFGYWDQQALDDKLSGIYTPEQADTIMHFFDLAIRENMEFFDQYPTATSLINQLKSLMSTGLLPTTQD